MFVRCGLGLLGPGAGLVYRGRLFSTAVARGGRGLWAYLKGGGGGLGALGIGGGGMRLLPLLTTK